MSTRLLRLHSDGSRSWLEPPRAGQPDTRPLWVVVPAEDVLLLTSPRVGRSERQLTQALPYAIEDQLAVPVETQLVAWAALPGSDDQVAVAVVARERIEHWLEQLRTDGLEPDVLVPESFLVPLHDGKATLLVEGERALLRRSPTQAFCGSVEEVSGLPLAEDQTVDRLEVGAPGHPLRALDVYAAQAAAGPGLFINLLQGEFAPRQQRTDLRRAWAFSAAAAALALVLAVTFVAVERQQLAARVEAQRSEMAELYRQLEPGDGPVASPEAFLSSALQSAGRAQPPVLELLGSLAPAVVADSSCRLQSLEYRNRVLEAVVSAPGIPALDALRGRLAAAGINAELTAATPGSQGVEGRLRLEVVGR